jgi:hypothetical protein
MPVSIAIAECTYKSGFLHQRKRTVNCPTADTLLSARKLQRNIIRTEVVMPAHNMFENYLACPGNPVALGLYEFNKFLPRLIYCFFFAHLLHLKVFMLFGCAVMLTFV